MNINILRVFDSLAVFGIALIIVVHAFNLTETDKRWFSVDNVFIYDTVEDFDPDMKYDRDVIKPFRGTWTVLIYKVGFSIPICSNHGMNNYIPNEVNENVTLSWYIEKDCKLPPGNYYMRSFWIIKAGISVSNTSNTFTIWSKLNDKDTELSH